MMSKKDLQEQVLLSRNYSRLCPDLIMRICEEEYPKYKKDKERLKAVKARLHTIYGAFFSDECFARATALLDKADSGMSLEDISVSLLKLHASTAERLTILRDFYDAVFSHLPPITSLLDIGCGFHPFSLPFMPTADQLAHYYAFDIDTRLPGLLNRYFSLWGLPADAGNIDIISEVPKVNADVAFLFKILPVIENQKKGLSRQVLEALQVHFFVITFPLKSLSGKNKGMSINYANFMEKEIQPFFRVISQQSIHNELIYIIQK